MRLLLSGLVSVVLLPFAAAATDAFYINNGTVDTPQVDAINFINRGLFQATDFGGVPYETSNTLNYTNKVGSFAGSGTMIATPGFRIDTSSTSTGYRRMASSFFNDNGAVVIAQDPFAQGINSFLCQIAPVDPSYLLVWATNIIIKGGTSGSPKASMVVGANGEMKLDGKHIDLSRSGLEVLPVWQESIGSFNGLTNYFPDIAIYDQYWGRTNLSDVYRLNSRNLWDGLAARAPSAPAAPFFAPGFTLFNPASDSYIHVQDGLSITITNFTGSRTNVTGTNLTTFFLATNITKGAVFVGAQPQHTIQLGFRPGGNGLDTVGVLLSIVITNVVTTLPETAYVFVEDRLGSGGTTGLLANVVGCPAFSTARPANYNVGRFPFSPGFIGNNGRPEPNFFVDSGAGLNNTNFSLDMVTNTVVTNGEYSAYGAFLDNVVSRPAIVPGGTVTNLPGRIRIEAETLDLTRARLRAEGEIIIQTPHLISSSNAVVDCENLSFNLSSTNGTLSIKNLSKESVDRLSGNIYMWSAVWSNTAQVIITNNYEFTNVVIVTPPSTNEVTNVVAILSPLTNFISIGFHTLMLDARALATVLPVTVHELETHSPNVIIRDNMTVAESILIDGKSLTLESDLTIPGIVPIANPIIGVPPPGAPFQDWTAANVPNLLFFTNHGNFSIANEAHFGDDRIVPYSTFVNTGTVSAASINLRSLYFQNGGSLVSVGPLTMQSTTAKLENGSSSSGGDSQFISGTLKFNNYQVTANGGLYLRVTNALFDAGPASANTFLVQNGFHLQNSPASGDLLGTTIQTVAADVPSIEIDHTWAGRDLGATAAGYSNNTAIGKLVLSHVSPDPLFVFAGTAAHNGLYVDLLDLTSLGTNALNQMQVDPSLVIYFAAAKLGFTPPLTNGSTQQAEEYLDGRLNGRLRWVKDFAGPNSSLDVLVNGQTKQVNKALRNSTILDSDGDGIPNFSDFTPFDLPAAQLTISINGQGSVTPDLNGQSLLVGQNYTITANPGTGFTFANWSGGSSSTAAVLTFTMQSNLVLVANFVLSPFTPSVGTYNGLFRESGVVRLGSSGAFSAKTTTRGTYSGRLQTSASRYSFSGQFDSAGAGTSIINRKDGSPLTLFLQMDIADNAQITGTLSDGIWTANLLADRAAAPLAGQYTLILPGTDSLSDNSKPLGEGFGTVKIDSSGRIKLKGTLADKQKLSQTASLSQDGRWPLFASLYRGQGQLFGWMHFTNAPESDVHGEVSWIKSPIPNTKYYPAGFDFELNAIGSLYDASANPLLNFSSGWAALDGGNLAASILSDISLGANGKITDLSGNNFSIRLNASQGLFKGSVADPVTGQLVPFSGAILQNQNSGHGFFLGTDLSGRVQFGQ